jgi:hypothetical protein
MEAVKNPEQRLSYNNLRQFWSDFNFFIKKNLKDFSFSFSFFLSFFFSCVLVCGLCRWPKCYHVLNWFFLSKPGFWEFIWIFRGRNHLKNQYLPHSESKSYQINSIKSLLNKIFLNNTKCTFQFLRNFQLRFNLIFSEEIIQYSRTFAWQVQTPWNQAHAPFLVEPTKPVHPSSSRAFQRHQRHDLKHPSEVGLITTKQNKLPSFIDRYFTRVCFLIK